MVQWRGGLFAMMLAACLAAGCGGDDGGSTCPTCSDACRHIYQTCKKSVVDNQGTQLTQAQCGTACTGSSNAADFSACVVAVKDCTDTGLNACLQNPPASTCGSGATKPPHTVDRNGVLHGSGSGTPSKPGTCGACHNGTKATACSDCH